MRIEKSNPAPRNVSLERDENAKTPKSSNQRDILEIIKKVGYLENILFLFQKNVL